MLCHMVADCPKRPYLDLDGLSIWGLLDLDFYKGLNPYIEELHVCTLVQLFEVAAGNSSWTGMSCTL